MQVTKYFSVSEQTSGKTKEWYHTIATASSFNEWLSANIPADATIDKAIIAVYCEKTTTTATGTLEITIGGTRAHFAEKAVTVSGYNPTLDIAGYINSNKQISGDIVFHFFFYNTGSITGTPKWTVKAGNIMVTYTQIMQYNITATSSNENYGTVSGGGTYDEGTNVTISATPKTGYKVAYWEKDGVKVENAHEVRNYTVNVDGNHTLNAVFEPITYMINFDGNGSTGGSMPSELATFDKAIYLPECGYTKQGYSFDGWSWNVDSRILSPGTEVINLCYYDGATFTFYAHWAPNEFSIRYNPNGAPGDPLLQNDMSVAYVNLPIQANPFERTGYTFINWNTGADGNGISLEADKLEPNIFLPNNGEIVDLYAQWSPNSYNVYFISNGGIGSMSPLQMIYDVSQKLTLNTFTKSGHTFVGWNTKQDGSGILYNDGDTVINLVANGQVSLYAQWEPIKYTITWKNWDGSELEQSEWDYGSIPSYSGDTESLSYETDEAFYDFDGWTPNISLVSGNITYTATYIKTIKTYTVTWVDWDGEELEVDTNVLYGDIPVFNYTKTPHKEPDDQYYYVFNNNWDIAIAPVTGNITYTAVYTKNIYYTVVWKDWNGYVLETDDKVMYDTPPSYDKEDPTRESTESHEYKFLGWKTEVSDEYADEDDLSLVRADITYIAVYEEIEKMYSFNVNILPSAECGRVEGYTDSEYKYGSELTLIAYPNDGYQFVSWSYTIDGVIQTVMSDRLEISIFEDTEVTALFEERSSLPAKINETQVESAYINPESLTITYVISGDLIESTIQNDIVTSVDGWSFVISNEIPEDGYKVDNIYIDDIRIY